MEFTQNTADNRLDIAFLRTKWMGLGFFVTLEDVGEAELQLGTVCREGNTLHIPLSLETYNLTGCVTVYAEEEFARAEVSLQSKRSAFLAGGAFAGIRSFFVSVKAVEGLTNILAEALFCPWWTAPNFPQSLSDVPEKTQLLLCRTEKTSLFCMPLPATHFKTDCFGSDRGLCISVNTYDCGLNRLEGCFAAFSADTNPFRAVEKGYLQCSEQKLIPAGLKKDKQYPPMAEYLGWCSWNAFYHDVDEKVLLAKLEELREKGVSLGWVLIDDGWSRIKDNKLDSFSEDAEKFPEGLKRFTTLAHKEYGIPMVGVWHALNGYWDGVHPGGEVAADYPALLSGTKDGYLLPGFAFRQAFDFYNTWHRYLRAQGIDFVKVDNQSSYLQLIRNNASVSVVAETQRALEASIRNNFAGPLINCMGMANENAFAREWTEISRSSDDFFPDREGSFISHIMQNAYNSVFYDQLFVCDYDMWWTQHPSARVSGMLRAISGGPVYISDKVGETNPAMLLPLTEEDGRILRCDHAAKPAASCLFENVPAESGLLKLTNRCGVNPVSAVFNLTHATRHCLLTLADTECDPDKTYLAYFYTAGVYRLFDGPIAFDVEGDSGEIINFYPVEGGAALVGDESKYIGGGSRHKHVMKIPEHLA